MVNVSETISRLDSTDLETRIDAYDTLVFETPELHPDWYVYFAWALRDDNPTIRLYGVFGIFYLREKYGNTRILAALLDHENEVHPGLQMLIESILIYFLYQDNALLRDKSCDDHPSAARYRELHERLGPRPRGLILDQIEDLMYRLTNRRSTQPRLQPSAQIPLVPLDSVLSLIQFRN